MSRLDGSAGSRHLVDPELSPVLDLFAPLEVSSETLPAVRAGVAAAMAGSAAAGLYPDVVRSDRSVPGLPGSPEVRVLVFAPIRRPTSTAALVWMHAGGFVLGAASDDDALCRRIASELGLVVVAVDYRLAPEVAAPGQLDDCYAALSWVHGQADELGVDRERIAVGGASAGGGLAACLAIAARDRGEFAIDYQALVYPMLDDRTGSRVAPSRHAGEFIWTASDNRFGWAALLGHEPGGADVPAHYAAARVASTAGLPATYLGVGSIDLFAAEDIEFAGRLVREGVATELHVYPGAYHGFTMVADSQVTAAHFRDLFGALRRRLCRPGAHDSLGPDKN